MLGQSSWYEPSCSCNIAALLIWWCGVGWYQGWGWLRRCSSTGMCSSQGWTKKTLAGPEWWPAQLRPAPHCPTVGDVIRSGMRQWGDHYSTLSCGVHYPWLHLKIILVELYQSCAMRRGSMSDHINTSLTSWLVSVAERLVSFIWPRRLVSNWDWKL